MSDISIRFDGLLLGLVMVVGAGLFAAITIVATIRTLMTAPAVGRSRRIAIRSAWLTVTHVVGLMILIACLSAFGTPPTGPDYVDWLTVPWCVFLLVAVAMLFVPGPRFRPDA
jgi:hypothetical protein